MGIQNSARRKALREKYERFSKAWRQECNYQRYMIDSGKATVEDVTRKPLTDKKLESPVERVVVYEDGTKGPLLGRKPTFNMWLQAMKNKAAAEAAKDEKRVDVISTNWEE